MDNSFNNQQKNSNGGLYAVIAILVVLVLVLGGFVVYKEFIQKDDNSSNANTNSQTNTDKTTNTDTNTNTETNINDSKSTVDTDSIECVVCDAAGGVCCPLIDYKEFDVANFDYTKVINGVSGHTYKYDLVSASDVSSLGLSVEANELLNGVTLTIDWSSYSKIYGSSKNTGVKNYNIDLSRRIRETVAMGYGQASGSETLFYLMADGTVEYTPIKKAISNNTVKSYGKISGVSDVVKIVQASGYGTCEGCVDAGYAVLGIKADGTFYDLSRILEK